MTTHDINSETRILQIRNLSRMANSELFFELRSIPDVYERRDITLHVYNIKMNHYRSYAAYRTSMAHHLVEEVHPMFRNAFEKVLRNSKEGDVKVTEFMSVNQGLHHHHEAEDDMWFPQLKQQHPHIIDELTLLEQDHTSLRTLENEVQGGKYAALTEFVSALSDHLRREEMLIVPCLLNE